MTKKAQQLTREQLLIGQLQSLEKSKGWKHIRDTLSEDLVRLEGQLKVLALSARTTEEIAQVNYVASKLEFIEDFINIPKRIIDELDPIIDTNTPE